MRQHYIWCVCVTFCVERYAGLQHTSPHRTLHVPDSSFVYHQEVIHCTLSNGICHILVCLQTAIEQD